MGEVKNLDDFGILILSHGRSDNMMTIRTLEKMGYTGKWWIVIDNEDRTADEYYKKFGKDRVVMFDKEATANRIDQGDNFPERRTILYARNESFRVAEKLGLKYFLQLDDDYPSIDYRWVEDGRLRTKIVDDFDELCLAMLNALEETGAKTICFGQGGDLIGGRENARWKTRILRKAMNSYFCRVDDPIEYKGKLNEDVTTYVLGGQRGELFFSIIDVIVVQAYTGKNPGGITDVYLDVGTYYKTFYSVMACPSAVTVSALNTNEKRVHHHVDWERVAVKIIGEEWRKA